MSSEGIIMYQDRLIAFLDILGFSSKLDSRPLIELHKTYSDFIEIAKNATFNNSEGDQTGRTNFAFSQFVSDSIILVSNPINDIYNINHFILAISRLLEIGFIHNFPLRGSVTRGDVLYDHSNEIFLSNKFHEAVKFEGLQEIVGCSILPSAESVILNAMYGRTNIESIPKIWNTYLHMYPIPIKDSKEKDLFSIDFTNLKTWNTLLNKSPAKVHSSTTKNLLLVNFIARVPQEMAQNAVDQLIAPKRKNTADYINYIFQLPVEDTQILTEEFSPAKYEVFFKTRTGFNIFYYDENFKLCNPGAERKEFFAVWIHPDYRD